jgi:hypothetical protein
MVNSEELILSQNIGRYRRGAALTNVVINGFWPFIKASRNWRLIILGIKSTFPKILPNKRKFLLFLRPYHKCLSFYLFYLFFFYVPTSLCVYTKAKGFVNASQHNLIYCYLLGWRHVLAFVLGHLQVTWRNYTM